MKFNQKKIQELCDKNNISFLALFGSQAREEAREDSDIDFLVRFKDRKGFIELIRIEREFKEAFKHEVDLVTEGALSPYIRDRVKKDLKVLYGQS